MKCLDYALKYIYRFPKTEKELKIKLLQKWFSNDEANKTLEILKSKNFVNDKLFAESYITSEISKKWKPPISIIQKLKFKWIDSDIINSVLDKNQDDIQEGIQNKIKKEIENYKKKWIEWFDIIQKLIKKWYKIDTIKEVILTNKK